jgi:hypothetical protein
VGRDGFFAHLGEPEAVYRPSPGQTTAGLIVAGGAAVACLAVVAFGFGLDATNRACAVLVAAGAVGLAVWLYRQRRWRLVIFAGGVVQVRPGGVDELSWADVREVVRTRLTGFGDRTDRVTVAGDATRVVVNPVNYHDRAKLFDALVAAAERRGIPVRDEWEETN